MDNYSTTPNLLHSLIDPSTFMIRYQLFTTIIPPPDSSTKANNMLSIP